jgi:peroxiredoxin
LAKNDLAAALAEICAMDAPPWRRLEAFVEKQREFKSPFTDAAQQLVDRLKAGDVGREAPKRGNLIPPFLLPDQKGQLRSLEDFTQHGPLVMSFNRGHWCPFCRIELTALAQAYDDFADLGATLISIMPDRQQYVGRLPRNVARRLTILSDIDNTYALSLGLVMWLGDGMRKLMADHGVDLAEVNGNDSWCVPVPATFVVDGNGRIVARMVEPDFRKRMSIEDIRSALRTERARRVDAKSARDGS